MPGPRHTRSIACDGGRLPPFTGGVVLCTTMICALVASHTSAGASDAFLSSRLETEFVKFMRAGLDRHPTVMLAGLTALAVPMVALARAVARAASDWRRRGERGLVPPGSGLVAHRLAWIETPDMRGSPVAIGELMRIGDSEDCDLAIPEASPGGTRALIQRTPENEFILFDVSAGEAYLAVNGAPSAKCRLNDGDRIEIGSACLMFRTGETAPLRTQSA